MNMLTKYDFEQIRLIIREEVSPMIDKALKPVRQDIQDLREDLNIFVEELHSPLEQRVTRIENHLDL